VDDKRDRSPVLKAFRLLAHLAASSEPVALADLSRALGLPKPTTHRLARSIERAGFVHKDPLTRRYRIGAAFENVALEALRHGAGHAPRRLLMNGLAERLGGRVNLVVLKAGNLTSVEWVESATPLRVDLGSNSPMPVHCTASGKLLLAFGSAELRKHVLSLAPLRAATKSTITSGRALARELDAIRERGFAEDDQELLPGVNCLAVPIYNRTGEVVAGLAVMAPAATLPLEKLRSHLQDIRKCAATISSQLGWNQDAAPAQTSAAAPPPHRGNGSSGRPRSKRERARAKKIGNDAYQNGR
jgi:DNA-binding IclR family transcriptional regulator